MKICRRKTLTQSSNTFGSTLKVESTDEKSKDEVLEYASSTTGLNDEDFNQSFMLKTVIIALVVLYDLPITIKLVLK